MGEIPTPQQNYTDISRMIDHALLTPTLTLPELEQGIELAIRYQVASVCILPFYLWRCAQRLEGTGIAPSTTIGFPHGGQSTAAKQAEAEFAIEAGCTELDMVVNLSLVRSGEWEAVQEDIQGVIRPAHAARRKVKVIFENCFLTDEQKRRLCQICGDVNADWVKTSTGFGTHGATLDDVSLMRAATPEHVQVKAAGGVRTIDDLLDFQKAGATRIGTSKTAELLDAWRTRLSLPPLTSTDLQQDEEQKNSDY